MEPVVEYRYLREERPALCAQGFNSPIALGVQIYRPVSTGQGLVEYALIIALVAIVAIGALQVLGNKANNSLTNASNNLS